MLILRATTEGHFRSQRWCSKEDVCPKQSQLLPWSHWYSSVSQLPSARMSIPEVDRTTRPVVRPSEGSAICGAPA